MCRRCACVGACARRKSVGRARVQPCVWDVCERAGLHAREPGQLWFYSCIGRDRGSSATIRFPYSFVCVCVLRHGETRTSVLSSFCGVLVCDLSTVQLWTVCSLAENTNFTARHPSMNWRRGFFAFDSWGRVVFVSVYALGVYTSASGLWHFFRLFKHLANLHERD